ncbi:MAG: methylmalonyl-CoA mutase family protein [Rikenellaceae bacterium]
MTNTKQESLFAEFPAISTEQWESVITKDLKGADYERKLVWKSAEGFNVRPYYRAEDLQSIKFLGTAAGQFPFVRGVCSNNSWRVHQTIEITSAAEANVEALEILMKGVDSIGFVIPEGGLSASEIDTLLKGIHLPAVHITFGGKKIAATAELIVAKLNREVEDKRSIFMNFEVDPMVQNLTAEGEYVCGGDGAACFTKVAELMKLTEAYHHIRVVTVHGTLFSNSGSTIVEELAFSLAAGHDYIVRLMEEGVGINTISHNLRFEFGVSSNYFMEIAKFRAARLLWATIVKMYGPKESCAAKMRIHAVTSAWNQTAYDPYVNMLRGTTEAMSASLAGVESLEVLPFNHSYEKADAFSKRIARNVELLLKHESHFDQVVDPAGGSYYIETLTNSIATEAWKLFQEVEAKGGYRAAYAEGFIVDSVKASAAKKDKNIATRREILLGANQYPNFTETASETMSAEAVTRKVSEGNYLTPYRGSMAFEQMRFEVDRSGKELKAFMLTCGNLGMARARSQFACNFFACAGIKVVDNTYFKSIEEGVVAAKEAAANIVVVCAADDDYATLAPQIKELLAGSATLVVAGAPACAAELEEQGITNFINVKSNVLETLKSYIKELGI